MGKDGTPTFQLHSQQLLLNAGRQLTIQSGKLEEMMRSLLVPGSGWGYTNHRHPRARQTSSHLGSHIWVGSGMVGIGVTASMQGRIEGWVG